MSTVIDRIRRAQPTVSRWTGAFATDPTAAGLEAETDIEELDFGTVAASANSEAKAISLEFADDFDDTVYGCRFWLCNKPRFSGHLFSIEQAAAALFPLVSLTTALTNGVALPGSPLVDIIGASTLYDSTNKRVRNIILQLQRDASTTTWNQANAESAPPILVMDVLRRDNSAVRLRTDSALLEKIKGHGFLFTDVMVCINFGTTANPLWHWIEPIKESSVELEESEEHAKWDKDHPKTVYQTARQTLNASLSFQVDTFDPILEALFSQTTAKRDSTKKRISWTHSSRDADTVEVEMAIQFRTMGGHTIIKRMPRVTLMRDGAVAYGSDDFAGTKIKGDVKADRRGGTIYTSVSEVAEETVLLPFTYVAS